MDQREADVRVTALNLNTPDTFVLQYPNKHGAVASRQVIYETDKEGPFKGLYNGNRRYLVGFSNGKKMGQ